MRMHTCRQCGEELDIRTINHADVCRGSRRPASFKPRPLESPDVAYDFEGTEIVLTLPQTEMLLVKPKNIKRVLVPGVGTFTKTEEWNEIDLSKL